MLKPINFLKKQGRFWRHIFNLLPAISFGGTVFILGVFAIAPNFMDFAHAEEGTTSPKQKDITLSMSIDSTFHKFDDIYLNKNGTSDTTLSDVLMIPTVKTNNPAGYKVYFSDADEDTNMYSLDHGVSDKIRSATSEDFKDPSNVNREDNFWYCGTIYQPENGDGKIYPAISGNRKFALDVPKKSEPRVIDAVGYIKPASKNVNNGVYCKISINKQITPSTYEDKLIFSTVSNTVNDKPAVSTSGKKFFGEILKLASVSQVFNTFKYGVPKFLDLTEDIKSDSRVLPQVESEFQYEIRISPAERVSSCPDGAGHVSMYNAAESEDMEPILVWLDCGDTGSQRILNWWTPSGKLSLGDNCAGFFSSGNSPQINEIDLSGIDISNCKNMESMFERTDKGFETIDLRNNKFSSEIKNTKKMFKNNPNLTTIYVPRDTDLRYVPESEEMFIGDFKIYGLWTPTEEREGCPSSDTYREKNKNDASEAYMFGYFNDGGDPRLCEYYYL